MKKIKPKPKPVSPAKASLIRSAIREGRCLAQEMAREGYPLNLLEAPPLFGTFGTAVYRAYNKVVVDELNREATERQAKAKAKAKYQAEGCDCCDCRPFGSGCKVCG